MSEIEEGFYLAIMKDDPQDTSITATYTVHFINHTANPLAAIMTDTSGYVTFGDELIKAEGKRKDFGPIKAGGSVVIGAEDEGSFDFDNSWTIMITTEENETSTITFALHKYGINRKHGRSCVVPVLMEKGYLLGHN